jgi:hypothetical protein
MPEGLAYRNFFHGYLIKGKLFFALGAFGMVLICGNKQTAAIWTRVG